MQTKNHRQVQRSFSNSEAAEVKRLVSDMLVALGDHSNNPEVKAASYVYAVKDLDPGLIRVAVDRFIKGQVEGMNPNFPPNTAVFRQEVVRLLGERQERQAAEERRQMQMLPPPQESEAERAMRHRIGKGLEDLAAQMRKNAAERKLEERKAREAMPDPLAAYKVPRQDRSDLTPTAELRKTEAVRGTHRVREET